jgi:uncharacterized RDD family membrane protein YckC
LAIGNWQNCYFISFVNDNSNVILMSKKATEIATFKKASFWRRLYGYLFDSIIFSALSGLVGLIFGLPDDMERWFYLVLFCLYNILMDYYYQGTFGKMIFKMKVINLERQNPDLLSSFYRNFGKIISALPFAYGFLRILAPHQQQTIHDELGKCYVIDIRSQKK